MVVEDLVKIGFNDKMARVLIALRDGPKSSPEIEEITGLRQPEVSRALTELRMLGFVEFVGIDKKFERGAPRKVWRLKKDFKEIIYKIASDRLKEYEEKMTTCVKLLFMFGEPITDIDPEIAKEILEMKDPVIKVEIKDDGEIENEN
jgi:predicted transcriptional regulator